MGTNYGYDGAYNLGAEGVTVTSSSTSQSLTIPNDSSGTRAKVVRVVSKGFAHIRVGHSAGGTVTATTNSFLVPPYCEIIINTKQVDTLAYLESDTAAVINVTPLEA